MRELVLSFALIATATGCGSREPTGGAYADGGPAPSSGCQQACLTKLERVLEQNFGAIVDCTEHGWAAARSCSACIQLLRLRYDVAVASEQSFCADYFP